MTQAYAANAGWYLMPEANVNYPLRRTKDAMRQGVNRFERGSTVFETAKRDAAARSCAFNWTLHTVSGAAHEQDKMAAATVLLLPPKTVDWG